MKESAQLLFLLPGEVWDQRLNDDLGKSIPTTIEETRWRKELSAKRVRSQSLAKKPQIKVA